MYQTDCPWEVSSTNRYTITTYEAAVTARRRLRQGEVIKYLTGTLVPLTTEESRDLDITNRNFSIVVNNRKKSDQMFLGPARFANHDCNSNARLQMEGVDSMRVVATRNIAIGEEITVSYGESYFGPDNVECLCSTCEASVRNGWTSAAAFEQPASRTSTPVSELPKSTLSKKRKRESSSTPRSLKRAKPAPSPSKLQYSWTPPSTSASEIGQEDIEMRDAERKMSATKSAERSTPQRDNKGRFLTSPKTTRTESTRNRPSRRSSSNQRKTFPLSPSTTSPSSQDSENEQAGQRVTVKIEQIEKVVLETDEPTEECPYDTIEVLPTPSTDNEASTSEAVPDFDLDEPTSTVLAPNPPTAITKLSMTKISTIATIEPTLNIRPPPTINPSVVPSIEPPVATTTTTTTTHHTALTVHPLSPTIRVPGDYILTRRLLAQPHDRWVRCQNDRCHGFFLQANGYQTRRECPRCERHSMLYGFPWPKTDPDARVLLARTHTRKGKGGAGGGGGGGQRTIEQWSAYRRQGKSGKGSWVEGGGDEEERVMDHRTVHRFVLPEEERELTRKGLLIAAESARGLGEDELGVLRALDGSGRRRETGSRGTTEEEGGGTPADEVGFGGGGDGGMASGGGSGLDGLALGEWLREEGVDGEGRRRSGRIVESRVYVSVDMKR